MADFTFDAVILKRIFVDDFNRTEAVGLGGPWTWNSYDSSFASAVDSTVAVNGSNVTVGLDDFDSYEGYVRPLQGDAYFDFYVPADPPAFDGCPTYGLLLDTDTYSGIYVESLQTGDWQIYDFQNFPTTTFTPDLATWYRIHGRWTDSQVFINAWKASDPEPAGWMYTATSTFDFGASDASGVPPLLDFFFFPVAGTAPVDAIDNVEIWSMSDVNANIDSFNLNAILRRTEERTGTPAAPVFVGAEYVSSWPAVSSLVVNVPSGVVDGDVMFIAIRTDDGATPEDATVTGWTHRDSIFYPDNSLSRIYVRVANSEPSTYTVNVSPSTGMNVVLVAWRGISAPEQQLTRNITNSGPPAAMVTAPTPLTVPGVLMPIFQSTSFGPGNMTPPTDFTEVIDAQDFFQQQSVDYMYSNSIGGQIESVQAVIDNPDTGTWRTSYMLLLGTTGSGFTLDASLFLTQFTFTLAATITTTRFRTTTFDAYIASVQRQQHDRGNTAHYGIDADTVITLASALGLQPTGATVHDLLVEMEGRITTLENS